MPKPASRLHDQLADVKIAALLRLVERLRRESLAFPVMAVELEFYLYGAATCAYPQSLLAMMDETLHAAGIAAHPAEEERGYEQYEVALTPQEDLTLLGDAVQLFPSVIHEFAEREGLRADFSPKPLPQDFGSAQHWHIHLETRRGENLFTRSEEGVYSRELLWAMGGLLHLLPESMLLFAPHPADYARFAQAKMNAPTTVSWGANNRSTALRLPNKPLNQKHIEHRVASANADPWLCMAAILAAVAYGLEHQIYPSEAIHGDASHPQYEADPLPDYAQALRLFQRSTLLPEYLGEELCAEFLRRILYPDMF